MNRIKFTKLKQMFHHLKSNYPIVFVSLQTGMLLSTGDFIAQTFVEQKKFNAIDFRRNSHFFIIGCGLVVY